MACQTSPIAPPCCFFRFSIQETKLPQAKFTHILSGEDNAPPQKSQQWLMSFTKGGVLVLACFGTALAGGGLSRSRIFSACGKAPTGRLVGPFASVGTHPRCCCYVLFQRHAFAACPEQALHPRRGTPVLCVCVVSVLFPQHGFLITCFKSAYKKRLSSASLNYV